MRKGAEVFMGTLLKGINDILTFKYQSPNSTIYGFDIIGKA